MLALPMLKCSWRAIRVPKKNMASVYLTLFKWPIFIVDNTVPQYIDREPNEEWNIALLGKARKH